MTWLMNGKGDLLVRLVRDIGFPIFVALYLLTQLTPSVQLMTSALLRLTDQQTQLVTHQDQLLGIQQAILDCVRRPAQERLGCGGIR